MSDDRWNDPPPAWMRLKKLPPMVGNGGPGTVFTATAFWEAVNKHGRPLGVFEKDRQLPYGKSGS